MNTDDFLVKFGLMDATLEVAMVAFGHEDNDPLILYYVVVNKLEQLLMQCSFNNSSDISLLITADIWTCQSRKGAVVTNDMKVLLHCSDDSRKLHRPAQYQHSSLMLLVIPVLFLLTHKNDCRQKNLRSYTVRGTYYIILAVFCDSNSGGISCNICIN